MPADTIRKWEQRYGVLRPERTTGGQRRYSDLDVARVEWLKARLSEGFRIGEAAALLGEADIAGATPEDLRDAIVDATLNSNMAALGSAVDQAMLLDSLRVTFLTVFAPALVKVGDLWETGRISVAQEHLASCAVRSALQRLLADQRGRVRGVAVLACAPGESHEVGLLMVAIHLRADGWQAVYLGADTPTEEAVGLAGLMGASALLFSASRSEPLARLRADLEAIRIPEGIEVVIGGRATDDRPAAPEAVATLR